MSDASCSLPIMNQPDANRFRTNANAWEVFSPAPVIAEFVSLVGGALLHFYVRRENLTREAKAVEPIVGIVQLSS